jgi:hypothetical protein
VFKSPRTRRPVKSPSTCAYRANARTPGAAPRSRSGIDWGGSQHSGQRAFGRSLWPWRRLRDHHRADPDGRPQRSTAGRGRSPPMPESSRPSPSARAHPFARLRTRGKYGLRKLARNLALDFAIFGRIGQLSCAMPTEVLQGSDLRCLKSDGEHRHRDLPVCPRHIVPSGAAIHDRKRRSGAEVPQLCGRDPPHAPISLAVPRLSWHRTTSPL